MFCSLGFDTLLISYDRLHFSEFKDLVEYFFGLGIKNFIFIFDYNPNLDSISLVAEKFSNLKSYSSKFCFRGMKIKCAFNLNICQGAAFNDSLSRIFANRNNKTIFLSLPIFTDTVYDSFALDINHLLYKKRAFPIFTFFDANIETSGRDFCKKFISNPRIGISLDINYIYSPKNHDIVSEILKSNCFILPSVSGDISNYAGTAATIECFIDSYGKNDYFKLCSLINRCSDKVGF